MAGEVLNVFQWDALRQKVGDGRHSEGMRRKMIGESGVAKTAFDHAVDVTGR